MPPTSKPKHFGITGRQWTWTLGLFLLFGGLGALLNRLLGHEYDEPVWLDLASITLGGILLYFGEPWEKWKRAEADTHRSGADKESAGPDA